MGKRVVQLLLCVFGMVGLGHLLPSYYRVRQSYEVSSTRSSVVVDAPKITTTIQEKVQELGIDPSVIRTLVCTSPEGPSLRRSCLLEIKRRSSANQIIQYLTVTLPGQLGWIEISVLDQRIEAAERQIDSTKGEIENLDAEWKELESTEDQDRAKIDRARRIRDRLAGEIENRTNQLHILDEALSRPTEVAHRPIFEKKRAEVMAVIEQLRPQLEAADKILAEVTAPEEHRKALQTRLNELRTSLDDRNAQIATWQQCKSDHSGAKAVADPDAFQLVAIGPPAMLEPIRDGAHTAWSIPLGILLFALVQVGLLLRDRLDTFSSSEEVEKETGLRLLGRLP